MATAFDTAADVRRSATSPYVDTCADMAFQARTPAIAAALGEATSGRVGCEVLED